MKLQRSVVAIVATTVAIGLAGCAGQPRPTETPGQSPGATQSGGAGGGAVTFRSWSPIQQTTDQMVAAYTAQHPEVMIDATIFNYPEYLVDLQTRASSNTMPDIIGLQPGALTQQYRGKLMPLQECAAKEWGADWKDKFYPLGLEQARLGNPDGDENYYALPVLDLVLTIWGNRHILSENGIEPPATWDELKAASDLLKGKPYAGFLMPGKDAWVRLAVWLQIANNIAPGKPYEAEDGKLAWNDPDILKSFEYWRKLFTDGIAQDGALGLDAYPSAVNQFEAGNAAMIPLGSWWIQQSDPTKSDIPPLSQGMEGYVPFLFPTIAGGAAESQLVGGADVLLGISTDSKNPDVACSVLTDWIAGAGAVKLINTFNNLSAVKGINPEKFTSETQKQQWELLNQQMDEVQYSRYVKNPDIEVAITDALSSLATGDMTPEQAAAAVQSAVDKAAK